MIFSLKHTIVLGWPVLSVLLLFSIVAVAIFLQCWTMIRRARAAVERGEKRVVAGLLDVMEERLALLGTIATAAPFVGLLGTVIGVIKAFHSISTQAGTGGGLAVVSGGISEALVTTAAGLAVAIPASMIYNYFTFHTQRIQRDAGLE